MADFRYLKKSLTFSIGGVNLIKMRGFFKVCIRGKRFKIEDWRIAKSEEHRAEGKGMYYGVHQPC